MGGRQIVDAQLTADDLQLDSFLPGSLYPVICSVQPTRWVPGRQASHAPRLRLALEVHTNMNTLVNVLPLYSRLFSIIAVLSRVPCPSPDSSAYRTHSIILLVHKFLSLDALLYAVQVHTALCDGELPALGFSNTWVKHAQVSMPPLAIAVDDVTMAVAEQLTGAWGSTAPTGSGDMTTPSPPRTT